MYACLPHDSNKLAFFLTTCDQRHGVPQRGPRGDLTAQASPARVGHVKRRQAGLNRETGTDTSLATAAQTQATITTSHRYNTDMGHNGNNTNKDHTSPPPPPPHLSSPSCSSSFDAVMHHGLDAPFTTSQLEINITTCIRPAQTRRGRWGVHDRSSAEDKRAGGLAGGLAPPYQGLARPAAEGRSSKYIFVKTTPLTSLRWSCTAPGVW